jgi:hypothetical protein
MKYLILDGVGWTETRSSIVKKAGREKKEIKTRVKVTVSTILSDFLNQIFFFQT